MSVVKPFKALRPQSDNANKVACVPYDVIYDSEVRELVAENPLSFLRVTRAEGEFPAGETVSHETANARARENLEQFVRDGILVADPEDAIYIYRLGSNGQFQTGIALQTSASGDNPSSHPENESNQDSFPKIKTDKLIT